MKMHTGISLGYSLGIRLHIECELCGEHDTSEAHQTRKLEPALADFSICPACSAVAYTSDPPEAWVDKCIDWCLHRKGYFVRLSSTRRVDEVRRLSGSLVYLRK